MSALLRGWGEGEVSAELTLPDSRASPEAARMPFELRLGVRGGSSGGCSLPELLIDRRRWARGVPAGSSGEQGGKVNGCLFAYYML